MSSSKIFLELNDDSLPLFLPFLDPSPNLLLIHPFTLPELIRLLSLHLPLNELQSSQVVSDRLALATKSGAEVGSKGDDGRSHEVVGDDLSVVGSEEEEEDSREERGVPFLQ